MNKLITLLFLVTLSLTALPQGRGRGNQNKKPPTQPPIVSAWSLQLFNNSTGQWEVGALLQEGLVAFLFTDYPRTVHRLTKANPGALYGNLSFSVTISTEGSPQFIKAPGDNPCNIPANFRAYVEAPDWYNPPYDYKRWWSNPQAVYLTGPTTVSMTIPIQGDQWSSVFGAMGNSSNEAAMGFQQAMNNPGAAGFTFGAGCFFGHGIYVTGGTAKFNLTDFRVGF